MPIIVVSVRHTLSVVSEIHGVESARPIWVIQTGRHCIEVGERCVVQRLGIALVRVLQTPFTVRTKSNLVWWLLLPQLCVSLFLPIP